MLGLCVSPGTMPSRLEVDVLDPPCLRSILYVDDDLDRLAALGRPLFLTLNNEYARVRGDWSGWEDAIGYVARRSRDIGANIIGLACGNELDIFWAQNEADVPPEFAADLVNRAQPMLRAAFIPTSTTSLAGPRWVEYATRMLAYCRPEMVDLHPYGWTWDGLEAKVDTLAARAGSVEIVCSEIGVNVGDAGGEEAQARALLDAAAILEYRGILGAWFAWHDGVGAPHERGQQAFGLVADDGRRRPAWYAYQSLNQEAPVQPGHTHEVGQGLREWMAEDGTSPIACSTFLPLGRNPAEIECAYAQNGAEYRWSLAENRRLARFDSAA